MDFREGIPADDLAWIDMVRGLLLNVPMNAYATYAFARTILREAVPGIFVECGVFAGVQPAIMWRAMSRTGQFRPIHLFDSFEGIPHAGENDTDDIDGKLFCHGRDGKLVSSGISACSVDQVKNHMMLWGVNTTLMVFHKGWVENTAEAAAKQIGPIAMLRIDVDLYSGTKTCLKHLLPLMSPGGILVMDDMSAAGARKAASEHLDMSKLLPIDGVISEYVRIP